MGSLLEQARKDARKIINSGGFEEKITISNPSGVYITEVNGLHSKHWISQDTDGNLINGKNAHICISEKDLTDAGLVTRNPSNQNVALRNYIVSAKDSSGTEKKYIINETFPSETLGLIVCILGDYNELLT